MDTQIELICEICGGRFFRRKAEVNRSKKLNRKNYCSLKCVGKGNNEHLEGYKWKEWNGQVRENDDLSPFRWHHGRIRSHCRKKKWDFNITLEDLRDQWNKQSGTCPYTGWKLLTPKNTSESLDYAPNRASLDRIDSSKPYTKDNIQFVSFMAQFAKNKWHEEELFKFCEAVILNKK